MAFYDWNNDGKKDWQDDFIEYNIYKESMEKKESKNTYRSNNGNISTFGALAITVAIFLLIGWIGMSCEAQCAVLGCHNKPEDGSSYCWLHRENSYHNYSNHKNSSYSSTSSSSTSYSNETSTSDYSSTSYRNDSEVATTKKYYSTKKYTTTHKSKDDPYDVYEYSDPEDFYYDNYDDFDCYEDAEDYYDEAWD